MQWILVGLGNPGAEYVGTRHNVGRDMLMRLADVHALGEWKVEKTLTKRALRESLKGELWGQKVSLVLPNTFMNASGNALASYAPSKKQLTQLVVVHDDLDLPLGVVKLSFGSGPGGHKGVLSVQKVLKSRDFVRVRVGVSPATPSGKLKKPDSEVVADFVLSAFKPSEREKLTKAEEVALRALELLLTKGISEAMMQIHTK